MFKDVVSLFSQVSEAFCWVTIKQPQNQILGQETDLRGKVYARRALLYSLVQSHHIAVVFVERGDTCEHLEDEHAEGVPVDRFVVSALIYDLCKDDQTEG